MEETLPSIEMATLLILWAIADALLLAGLLIMVFRPIREGQQSLWSEWVHCYHSWRFKALSNRVALMEDIIYRHGVDIEKRSRLAAHINSVRAKAAWHLVRSK